MNQPFEPQPGRPAESGPWQQPPITELSSQPWDGEDLTTTPTSGYTPPDPYGQYHPPSPYASTGESTAPYAPPNPYAPQYGAQTDGMPPYLAGVGWPADTAAPVPVKRGRLRWVVTAGVAALVLVGGGVSYAAYSKLNGGGTQPDAVTPSDAIGFVKLDLNPSASQKIAAARFLGKLPHSGGLLRSSGGDWREGLFNSLLKDSDSLPSGVDYDHDVKPWLGQRMAVAVLPADSAADPNSDDSGPQPLLVLQSTDDGQAKQGIAHFDPNAGVDFYKGYALIAETQKGADRALADVQQGSLASAAQYRADMAQVGSPGVASGWFDLTALRASDPTSSGPGGLGFGFGLSDTVTGRVAFTLRFNGKNADLTAKTIGGAAEPRPTENAGQDLGALPASTIGGFTASYQKKTLDDQWSRFKELLGSSGFFFDGGEGGDPIAFLQDDLGLDLPTDLETLIGTNVTVGLDSASFTGSADSPTFGVLTKGDGNAATKVMDKIRDGVSNTGTDLPIVYKSTGSGLALASDQSYLDELTSTSGAKLSGVANFATALPDVSGASMAAFVNLDAVADAMRKNGASGDDLSFVSSFSAAGFTSSPDGSMHLRLVAH